MDSRQEAKLNMYHAVINQGNSNLVPIESVPAFDNVFTIFSTKVSSIVTTAQLEAQVITGVATDKKVMRETLCRQTADIAAAVYPYAVSTGNNTLKEQVAFSKSDLRNLRDDQLAPTCRNIHDLANANLVALADYGITAPMLASLNTLIGSYEAKVPTPRNAASLKKTYATNLKTLFKDCDSILKNQMDKLAVQTKTAFPDFYTTYKNNRIILDAATSSTQVAGAVIGSNDSQPVSGVAITVTGQAYIATTNATGEYTLKIPVPGTYSLKFTKAGFQDKTINNVEVKLGQSTSLNITLNI
jgi:hypothetical protein